ncbi:MAG: serine/threonine-protein kinase [Bacteroidota bacterium]
MTADRWRQIEAVFTEAADLPPDRREAFLDRACQTPDGQPDATLRTEVEAMLAAETSASEYFDAASVQLAEGAAGITSRPPERAGPWHPVELIGRGGMGEVYRAERADAEAPDGFAQTAALKLVQPGLAPDLVARFHAERRILASLDHPGIARLLDGGTASDGRPYLAMELVHGEPITAYCDRHRLGVDERLALFAQVCDAVAYAHQRLVVHRDLKPSNVLVEDGAGDAGTRDSGVVSPHSPVASPSRAPRVKLLDFGVARLLDPEADATRTGLHALTPEYAAPEQLRGDPPSTATDVYALGVLLYELLAGQRPFRLPARLAVEAARVVMEETPTDPSAAVRDTTTLPGTLTPEAIAEARATRPDRLQRRLRGDLDRIAQVALRKEPDRRYASAASLGQDIRRHLSGLPVEARPATLGYRLGRFVRRHRGAVLGTAAALAAVVAVAGLAFDRVTDERDRAERALGLMETVFQEGDPYRDEAAFDSLITAQTPLGDALYAAALRVERETADDPDTRHRLLGALTGAVVSDSLRRDLHERRLRLAEEAFGPDDRRTAEATGALGYYLSETARDSLDLARAESLLRRALALTEAASGPDAQETGGALVTLATHLKDTGAAEEAEGLARRGVEIARRHQPEARTSLETALMIHGLTLKNMGDAEGAYRAAKESVEIAREVRGEGGANLVSVLANAALAAEAADKPDEALAYHEEATRLAVQNFGAADPTTLTVRMNLATALQQAERYTEAEREHREILAVRLAATDGTPTFDVAASYNQLGNVLRDDGRLGAASEAYRQAAEAFDAVLPQSHPVRAIPYVNLAKLDAERGAFAEAERYAREAVRLAALSFPEDDPMQGHARARLGRALLAQNRPGGRPQLEAGLQILRQRPEADPEALAEAEGWLTDPR